MIGGLILAAGAGTRFGEESKLLAELDGRPLLQHAIAAQCAVPALSRVVVVLGSRAEAVHAAVDLDRAEAVICEDWRVGQSASLRCGVAALTEADEVLITLGDQPRITAAAIERVLDAGGPARACYEGRPSHPVLLGPTELVHVAALTGDVGARELLAHARLVECADIASDRDVDTTRDLAAVARAPTLGEA